LKLFDIWIVIKKS